MRRVDRAIALSIHGHRVWIGVRYGQFAIVDLRSVSVQIDSIHERIFAIGNQFANGWQCCIDLCFLFANLAHGSLFVRKEQVVEHGAIGSVYPRLPQIPDLESRLIGIPEKR